MNKQSILVEQATARDADEVALLVGKLLGEIMQAIGAKVFDFDVRESKQLLRSFINMGRYSAFVARNDEARIIGLITLSGSYALYAGGLFGTIPEFYVERRVALPGRRLGAG